MLSRSSGSAAAVAITPILVGALQVKCKLGSESCESIVGISSGFFWPPSCTSKSLQDFFSALKVSHTYTPTFTSQHNRCSVSPSRVGQATALKLIPRGFETIPLPHVEQRKPQDTSKKWAVLPRFYPRVK